jgi:hypothetical protein
MSTLLLSAVDSTGREACIALSADHLLAVKGLGKGGQGRVVDATT